MSLEESLKKLLTDMGTDMADVLKQGPGTRFRLTFTKEMATAEFFMGETKMIDMSIPIGDQTQKQGDN